MTCDDARDLVALHALGAADPAEVRLVDEHAAVCDACARELASMRRTVSSLALAGDPVAPPAALRDRVLSRTGATGAARSMRLQLAFPLAAAAMLLVALAVGAVVLSRRGSSADERLAALLADPDAWFARLESTTEKGRGVATAVYEPATGEIRVFARGLAAPAAGRTHVVWLLPKSGAPVNARAAARGEKAWVIASGAASGVEVAGVAISEEASPGVSTPTTVVAAGMR